MRSSQIPRHYLLSLHLFSFVILLVYLKEKKRFLFAGNLLSSPYSLHFSVRTLSRFLCFSFVSLFHTRRLFMPTIATEARNEMNGTSEERNYTCLSYTRDYIIKGRVRSWSKILLRCTRYFQVRYQNPWVLEANLELNSLVAAGQGKPGNQGNFLGLGKVRDLKTKLQKSGISLRSTLSNSQE